MHLVDHARDHIEATYRRPVADRLLRAVLASVLPDPNLFRWAVRLGRLAKPFAPAAGALGLKRLAALMRLTPTGPVAPPRPAGRQVYPAQGPRRGRVALLSGCVGAVLGAPIQAAAIRVLNRHGVEVVVAAGDGCCGSLAHHMGREAEAFAAARADIDAWTREADGEGLDAILTTVSGCGTTVKDYGFMLRTEPAYAAKAARVAGLARDISEYLATMPLAAASVHNIVVAYHSACSLQHGQKINREPKEMLCRLGFVVKDVPEGHLCCGSAGTYNILQPDLAQRLRERKIANIESVTPDVIAAGNIGCITQIATGTAIPIAHTVELIDWATGGPCPAGLNVERVSRPPTNNQSGNLSA
jgi:glycolate oxidase iron-sulfur subunit